MIDIDRIARRELARVRAREEAICHGRGRPDMLMLNHLVGFGAAEEAALTDPYWANVAVALHMDGTNGSTTFTELKGRTITRQGNAQISTAQSKFGGASGYFDNTTNDAIYINNDSAITWSGDFTVDFWIYPTNNNTEFSSYQSSNTWEIYLVNNTTLDFRINNNISPRAAQWTGSSLLNAWHFIEVSRASGVCRLFVDGVLGATSNTDSTTFAAAGGYLYMMKYFGGSYYQAGYMDDFRLTLGVARHTSAYTPPTAAFPES